MFLKRDFKMVKAADLVVAFPSGRKEQRSGSGPWAVIREARRKRVPLVVVYPVTKRFNYLLYHFQC